MTLNINGEVKEFGANDLDLRSLLSEIGLAGKPVVIEMNRQAVLPGDHATTRLKEGDSLEIVMIAAGG